MPPANALLAKTLLGIVPSVALLEFGATLASVGGDRSLNGAEGWYEVLWERLVVMVYSLVAVAIALASILGAWGLTKEALKRESDG